MSLTTELMLDNKMLSWFVPEGGGRGRGGLYFPAIPSPTPLLCLSLPKPSLNPSPPSLSWGPLAHYQYIFVSPMFPIQNGGTALMLASINGHEAVVKVLLDAECAKEAKDKVSGSLGPWRCPPRRTAWWPSLRS